MSEAYNGDVDVAVEFAYGDDVYETSPTWVDMAAHVRDFSIVRGRNSTLDVTNTGHAQITLTNTNGELAPWSGSTFAGTIMTPVRIVATYNGMDYPLFRGFVTAWPTSWPAGGKDSVVKLDCHDAFHLFAMAETELTETNELSGTRIGNLLDVAGWPAGWRTLDAGKKTLQVLQSEFNSVLGEIRRAVLVEDGLFWIDGGGTAIFKDGHTRIEDTSIVATFSDTGNVRYTDLMVAYDTDQVWNEATVTRANGVTQIATSGSSQAAYGRRDLHLSDTLHISDGEADAFAGWMMTQYAVARARVPSLTVVPEKDPATIWPVALGLDFWQRVNVERAGTVLADPLDANFWIEGVTHNVTMTGGRKWHTTFQFSPDLQYDDWWVLGTSELGTDTRLAY